MKWRKAALLWYATPYSSEVPTPSSQLILTRGSHYSPRQNQLICVDRINGQGVVKDISGVKGLNHQVGALHSTVTMSQWWTSVNTTPHNTKRYTAKLVILSMFSHGKTVGGVVVKD